MGDVPRSDRYDDVYFSAEGGAAETRHVFLQGNDLPARWQGQERPRFSIGETGFGTGLNFLLAWKLFDETAPAGAFLDFVSVEKYPLSVDEIRRALQPWSAELSPYLEHMLARYPRRLPGFHRIVFGGRAALTLIFDDVSDALPQIDGSIDAWFLDGFTPAKNPDMWTQGTFDQMARLSHPGTSFATFTAAGFVKRGLQAAGFTVQKRPGFGSKRDMLAGFFNGGTPAPARFIKTVAVIGAGLAGTACAHVLRQYGFIPTLYDAHGMAAGASGNALGLVNPRLSALRDGTSDFYTAAYGLALRELTDYALDNGALHLITDADKDKRFTQTMQNWAWQDQAMQRLDARAASEIAGVSLAHEALYLPYSMSISPVDLCHHFAHDVPFIQKDIQTLDDIDADAIILANGVGAARFHDLPIHSVRGQLTTIAATNASSSLRAHLHYGGYLSAARNGMHVVGSTFQRWQNHTEPAAEDDIYNLTNMQAAVPALAGDYKILSHRAALRCSCKDRFPLIGRLTDRLYVSSAHGSHGIVSSLAGAHFIADLLRGGVCSLSKVTQSLLDPRRFIQN